MRLSLLIPIVLLAACEKPAPTQSTELPKTVASVQETSIPPVAQNTLEQILEVQTDKVKSRYSFRHPQKTLEFFDINSGLTVAEILPGGGWYSKILLPTIGEQGALIGIDYGIDMWPLFSFVDEKFMDKRGSWANDWPQTARDWDIDNSANLSAYTFSTLPAELAETVDRVLFIRALHNLKRFENKGDFLAQALRETRRILKPDGLVGVVQHQASEEKSDEWANGERGYLKKSSVISLFKAAGFELLKESDMNINEKDLPLEDDIVWRLPPSFFTSKDNPELKQQYLEIGESNRMTLVFRKI